MKKETLNELKDLKSGNVSGWSKDTEKELSETFSRLISLNVLRKERHSIRVNDIKSLSKIIEFESIDKYIDWLESKDDSPKIEFNVENFIGRDNLGIQSSDSEIIKPNIQNTKKHIEPIKPTKSVLKTIYWIFGILVAITILYAFIVSITSSK